MSISDALQRLQVVQTPVLRGWTVAQTCEFYGISAATFYVWRARFRADGVVGLQPRSRRPHTSPGRTPRDVEDAITGMRRAHPGWGARRIRDQLVLAGQDPPAVSTIHAVLVRHGLVEPQPSVVAAPGRFERDRPNDLWQIDATEWELTDGSIAQIIDIIDDHSRMLVAAMVWPGLSGHVAWVTLAGAIDVYGPPRQLLSDNARWLTGRSHGGVATFERRCWRLHIDTIQSSAYHPQTLGKLERHHRTVKQWLADQPAADTIATLQILLDNYRHHYNHHRPHQGINGTIPAIRYHTSPNATPTGPPPTIEFTRTVAANGVIHYAGWHIHIGRRWATTAVTLIEHADKLRIIHADQLIATVSLDPNLHPDPYISTGQPRGRPTRPPT